MTPSQRSLKYFRDHGWTADICERWNSHAMKRKDLFGFLDLVCIRRDMRGVLGVQATSRSNMSARVHKILAIPEAETWLLNGNRIIVIGWAKRVWRRKDGQKAKRPRWEPKTREIFPEDFT